MKKYDIYGMGNALVDMEFKVSDEFLTDHLIEKGLMTLVEKERQDHLLKALSGNNVGHSQSMWWFCCKYNYWCDSARSKDFLLL
nr:hypothetical protein [Halobacteriovorax sp. BALOs_7]